jgi:DNA-cytosine methyltransferase
MINKSIPAPPINVLSLFDGMSCGRIALERAGIRVGKYYASEIDKYAEHVSNINYPDIIRMGDVTKWKEWDMDWGSINLILAGFPCQAWSLAGKQGGDTDPRGALVHDLIGIWEIVKRKNQDVKFLFENVKMKKEFMEYISKDLFGVEPVLINSALVSAQNRQRYYWTSANDVPQPKNLGIVLEDIISPDTIPVIKSHGELVYKPHKSQCLDANYYKGVDNHGQRTGCIEVGHACGIKGHAYNKRVYSIKGKARSLAACSGGNLEGKVAIDAKHWRKLTPTECERLQTLPEGYTEGVSNTQRYKMIGNGWTVDVIAHILREMYDRG